MNFSHSLDLESNPFENWENILCKTMDLHLRGQFGEPKLRKTFQCTVKLTARPRHKEAEHPAMCLASPNKPQRGTDRQASQGNAG